MADLIRGKKAVDAQNILNFTVKGSSRPVLKLLNSALSNAKSAYQLEASSLYISKIEVNEGPRLKRWRARARGQAAEIQKKTSHISIVLDEVKGFKKAKVAKSSVQKAAAKKAESKIRPEKPRFRPASELGRSNPQQGFKKVFRRKTV